MLPAVFAKLHPRTQAPWVAIITCAVAWALCLGLGFERLITLDVLLSGASVILEFLALVALRIKEPRLDRPFRVPGGMLGACLLGVCPLLLLGLSVFHSAGERILGIDGLLFSVLLMLGGFIIYWAHFATRSTAPLASAPSDSES
jgi:amino acid transporter